jgi:hypothetical protein
MILEVVIPASVGAATMAAIFGRHYLSSKKKTICDRDCKEIRVEMRELRKDVDKNTGELEVYRKTLETTVGSLINEAVTEAVGKSLGSFSETVSAILKSQSEHMRDIMQGLTPWMIYAKLTEVDKIKKKVEKTEESTHI